MHRVLSMHRYRKTRRRRRPCLPVVEPKPIMERQWQVYWEQPVTIANVRWA